MNFTVLEIEILLRIGKHQEKSDTPEIPYSVPLSKLTRKGKTAGIIKPIILLTKKKLAYTIQVIEKEVALTEKGYKLYKQLK